jgi:hypothetical protein
MGFIKKRLFMILCLLVGVAGFSLLIPGFMTASQIQKEKEKVISATKSVADLRRKAQELNDAVLDQYKQNAKKAQEDQKQLELRAAQTTDRELIFKDVFPEPSDPGPATVKYRQFANLYCTTVDGTLKLMNAGDRPSDAEEHKVLEDYQKTIATSSGMGGAAPGMGMGGGMPRGGDFMAGGREGMMAPPGGGMPGRVGGEFGGGMGMGVSGDPQAMKQIESFRKTRAESISVYANRDTFFGWDYWKNFQQGEREKLLKESWFTQLAAWIQEDVVLSIRQMNGESTSVPKSPVKRLIEVSYSGLPMSMTVTGGVGGGFEAGARPMMGGMGGGMGPENVASRRMTGGQNSQPCYVIKRAGGAGAGMGGGGMGMGGMGGGGMGGGGMGGRPGMGGGMSAPAAGGATYEGQITPSWTHRSCDDIVDVVQFEVAVVIDTDRINDFINVLQSEKTTPVTGADGKTTSENWRNQITVLLASVDPVSVDAEKNGGYYYGSASLGVLRVVCEYLFFKSGYDKYKSNAVKKVFEAPTAMGGMGGMEGGGGGGRRARQEKEE